MEEIEGGVFSRNVVSRNLAKLAKLRGFLRRKEAEGGGEGESPRGL